MPYKNKLNKTILSAGEISTFIVCQEAWRLEYIKKLKIQKTVKSTKGIELHNQWQKDYEDGIYFSWVSKFIIYLLLFTFFIYLIGISLNV